MGFGHRVYRAEDPRARVLRRTAREIGAPRLEVAEQLEQAALAELKARKPDRVLATNVEFWSAVVLDYADVPPELFTPMFSCARVARLGGAHPRAEARGPADPADRQVRRAEPAGRRLGQRRRAELMEAAARGGHEALSARTKQLVLVAAILGTTVVTIDSTVANVALPAIADDLGGGLAGQQWTANAYLVTLASLLLIGGSLGDIFGERRVFALGVLAVRRDLADLRPGADDRDPRRRPRAAGHGGRAAHAGGARGDRVDLPARRARQGGRRLDRVGRDRHRARARWSAASWSTRPRGAGSSPSTCRSCWSRSC